MWRVVCNKNDAPGTLYDQKWKADRAAGSHRTSKTGHKTKVQRLSVQIKVEKDNV